MCTCSYGVWWWPCGKAMPECFLIHLCFRTIQRLFLVHLGLVWNYSQLVTRLYEACHFCWRRTTSRLNTQWKRRCTHPSLGNRTSSVPWPSSLSTWQKASWILPLQSTEQTHWMPCHWQELPPYAPFCCPKQGGSKCQRTFSTAALAPPFLQGTRLDSKLDWPWRAYLRPQF